ncbi:transcription factor IIF subunit TFG2 [Sporobolomyces koalae]|uniref:transcription factor IIF subunit TFG2 n=1 Tax=Sporobolomyces koalae TaxID=500713 RepID=UPI00317C5312
MSFPTNTLPEEFQQEHGTIDLDVSTTLDGDAHAHHDEDLDLDRAGNRVWLCKVPRFLMDKWNDQAQQGAILGRVRVYDEKDEKGNPKIAVLLNDALPTRDPSDPKGKRSAASDGLPTEYRLTMQNTASKNMYVFGERIEDDEDTGEEGARKKRRVTSMLGTVHHECSLTPSLASKDAADSYARILRERQRKAAEPKRTLKMLDVDQATANRLASGMGMNGVKARVSTFQNTGTSSSSSNQPRFSRMPHNELLDLLISQFAIAPYWAFKALNEHVKQPQTYLKQTLSEVANLVKNGPYAGMWALKPEFKQGLSGESEHAPSQARSVGVKKEDPASAPHGGVEAGSTRFAVKAEEDASDGESDDEDDNDEGMEYVT